MLLLVSLLESTTSVRLWEFDVVHGMFTEDLIVIVSSGQRPSPHPGCLGPHLAVSRPVQVREGESIWTVSVFLSIRLHCSSWTLFSTPRISGGLGGGVATLLSNKFKRRTLHVDMFSSFEVQLLTIEILGPFVCTRVQSPRISQGFIYQISQFLSDLTSRCDRLLILGHFNIHLSCPAKHFVKDFTCLLESLNLVQFVL